MSESDSRYESLSLHIYISVSCVHAQSLFAHVWATKCMWASVFRGFEFHLLLFCLLWIRVCVYAFVCICMCIWVCLLVDFCWPDSWTASAKQHNRSLTLIPTPVTISKSWHPTAADQGILSTCVWERLQRVQRLKQLMRIRKDWAEIFPSENNDL